MRIGFTPCPELNAGFSYGYGPFMADQSNDSASAIFSDNPTEYPQRTYGGDFTFAMNHVTLYGEAIYNIWYFEDIPNLEAFGYSIEGRWAVTPRFFAAARAGGVRFNEISGDIPAFPSGETSYSGRWDHNAIRLEGSIGLRVSRETLLKAIYEHDNTGDFAGEPNVDVFALQTVFSF